MTRTPMAIVLTCVVLLTTGCARQPAGTAPGGTPIQSAGTGLLLEVEPALAAQGTTVSAKPHDAGSLLLVFGSPDRDHPTTAYSYTLYDRAGKKMYTNAVTIPSFKKGEKYEFQLENEELPKVSRLVIGPFGKQP